MDCKILRSFSVTSIPVVRRRTPFGSAASMLPTLTSAGSSGAVCGLSCVVSFNRKRLYGSNSGLYRVKLIVGLNQSFSDDDHSSKFLTKAASGQPLESDQGSFGSKSGWETAKDGIDAFYRFTRPHTVIGTTLSIMSVSLLAIEKLSDLSPLFFIGVLEAIMAALFMNVYIVGLNQLTDIEIDKVNKPYLPLASGEYSNRTGVLIVTSFAIVSFWLGWIVGSWPLFWALFISFLLGTAYSINLPMLRWKRSALVAAMCILAVRAVIVQLAFYIHVQTHVFQRPAVFSKPLIFATAFMSFFSIVIALFKDIPDIEGDKIFGIQSYTVRLGQERVFWICIALLEMAYGVAICIGVISPSPWSKLVTVMTYFLYSLSFLYQLPSQLIYEHLCIFPKHLYLLLAPCETGCWSFRNGNNPLASR